MADIVVFDNASYVDTSGTSSSESDNTQATLAGAGHTVTTFTGTDAASVTTALTGVDAIVIPEMERGTWIPSADVTALLQDFVDDGGTLVIHGYGNPAAFLNSVFGFSVTSGSGAGPYAKTADATGAFATAPASLPWNNGTQGLSIGSLPAGSKVFYGDGSTGVMIEIPYGSGSILFAGWDWYNAAPAGSLDGGWMSAYAAALTETIGTTDVVNFDSTSWGTPDSYSEDGLTFTTPSHLHFETDMDADGKFELGGHNGGTETIEITKTGGGSFSLIEMDTAQFYWGSYSTAVEWVAYKLVGGVYVESGRMVITPGTHVTFTSDFQDIDKVVWNSAYTGYGGLAVDNIRYTTGSVPANAAPGAPVDTDATGDIAGASATVAEDLAVGSAIGLDADASDGDGDTVSYHFKDGDGNFVQTLGSFTIDAATGVVTLSTALDYETAASHVLRIYASDGTDSSYSDFTVNVTNVAPSDPVDGDSAADTLEENAPADTYTGVTAASSDVNGGTVTYALTDTAGGRFKIDAATGAILATGAVNIDYETAPLSDVNGRYYEVKATATDGTDVSNETTFKIYVTNFVEHLFTAGNDVVDFNALADGAYDFDGAFYNALAGDDQVILPDVDTVDAGNPWDYNVTFVAGAGNDIVQGGDGNDIVSGGEGNDWLFGGDGNDRLIGSSGNDILAGGDGADKLTGSDGRDIFIFTDSEIGTTRLGEHDVITDFKAGEDKIDISALYDDGATFGGLRNGKLTGAANSYYKVGYYSESGKTWLEGDTTGDGVADFVIEMSGSYKLKASDFVVATPLVTSEAAWNAAVAPSVLDYETFHRDAYFL